MDADATQELHLLRRRFIFAYVDKFASKFLLVCRKQYASILLREFVPLLGSRVTVTLARWGGARLVSGELRDELFTRMVSFLRERGTHEVARESADVVQARHLAFLAQSGLGVADFLPRSRFRTDERGERVPPEVTLAYPMASAKFHKQPMGWRYIACSASYTLRALSVWLGRAFSGLLPVADSMWDARMREAKVYSRGSWVLRDSQGVPSMVRQMNNDIPVSRRAGVRLQTFDFAKMYTNIRLDVLKERMRHLFTQLFKFQKDGCRRHRFLRVSTKRDGAVWVSGREGDTAHAKVFDVDKLSAWFAFLVDNVYLTFTTDMVLRQRIGIPMGTNCAVFVANLFCYSYEYDFISRLVAAGKFDLLRRFRFTRRFVDDLLSCDNPDFCRYLYVTSVDADGIAGIYPSFLRLSGEQDSLERVSFLDTYVAFDGRSWFTKTYDKREHPPLSRVDSLKYPDPSCYISDRAKFGIITSRLHGFGRICTRRADFVRRARMFLREFRSRGYPVRRMWGYVLRFVRTVPLAFPVTSPHALVKALMT